MAEDQAGDEPDDTADDPATAPAASPAADPRAGADLVRQSLARAKAARRARGAAEPRRYRRGPAIPAEHDEPVAFGASLKDLVEERGWSGQAAAASVLTNWEALVGAEIASHCSAVRLTGGELVVEAESTAWATQLRLLSRQILETLARQLGPRTVTRLSVRGPSGPSWRHGRFRVLGPGPRDTYG